MFLILILFSSFLFQASKISYSLTDDTNLEIRCYAELLVIMAQLINGIQFLSPLDVPFFETLNTQTQIRTSNQL